MKPLIKKIFLAFVAGLFWIVPLNAQNNLPAYTLQYADHSGTVHTMDEQQVTEDFGRRPTNSRWHKGVDVSTGGGDTDIGHTIFALHAGTVTKVQGDDGFKYIVIQTNSTNPDDDWVTSGYAHIFRNRLNTQGIQYSEGNFLMKRMDAPFTQFWTIIYLDNSSNFVHALSNLPQGTVTYNGQVYNTTNQVTQGQAIAPLGDSGGPTVTQDHFDAHLHLYSFTLAVPTGTDTGGTITANDALRTTKDPCQFLNYDEPDYDFMILTDNLTYAENDYSSIEVECRMSGESGGRYDVIMDIDDVELFIKKEDDDDNAYELIKGVWLESKISHGARTNLIEGGDFSFRYPSVNYPSHNGIPIGNNFPFDGVDIAYSTDAWGMGDRDRTGILSENYQGSTSNTINPPDNFYFSDIKLRIHQDDFFFQGKTAADIQYAAVNEVARYPDGEYDLYAKATTVRNEEHESDKEDPTEIEIDNFRPYITHLEVREGTGEIAPLIYQGQWDWDGTNLQLGPFSNPIANKIPPHTDGQHNLEIFLKTSEYMKELDIDIVDANGSYGQSFFTTSNTEGTEWTITIPASAIPSTAFGDQTIHITGKDRTNNDVLGFNTQYNYAANQLPHRVGSGSTYTTANWSVAFPATTDQVHIFEISDCVYNEGGNKKSGNDCLADFTATANYQNASLCGLSNPIPYIHPINEGFFVQNNQGGQISLDASTSISTSPNPLAFLDYEWYFYPDNPINFNPNGPTNNVYWTTPGDKVIELRIQCDGACSTKRINVAVAESPCTETKTPVFEPDQLAATDIVASFFHPAACEYVGQASCPNSANFNNGQIITNPHYYGASGCYELDVYEIVNGTQIAVVQNLYETGAYTLDCLEEGIYRVVMKDNVSACEIEQFVYLRDKNPVIAFDIAPVCDGNGDKAVVSAYIEEPLGCMTVVQVEGGGQGIGGSVIVTENQPINVYLGLGANQILYLQNQTIDIPEISQLSLNFTVTSTSGSNQCDGSIAPTASNGSGNYTYTVDGGSISGLCTGQHQLVATDTETNCSISTIFTVYAQINKPNNPDIIEVFTIHPNPFDDLVNISTTCDQLAPGDNSQIPVTISIYNSSGGHALTVYSGNLAPQQNHTFPVDVSNFSSGTYIFTIEALGQGESLMGIKN